MSRLIKSLVTACLFFPLALSGCGRSSLMEPGDLLSIRVLPDDPEMYIGQILQLRVEGVFLEREADEWTEVVRDITGEPGLALRISQPDVIGILKEQRLIAREAGNARLLADFAGRQDSISVDVSYAVLSGIDAQPDTLVLEPSDYEQLVVLGNLSDGSQIDLTQEAAGTGYSSDDQSVASVTVDGMVFGLAGGDTTVHVRHGDFTDNVAVSVLGGPQLTRLDVYPGLIELVTGGTAQLHVVGTYDDGSTRNLTDDAGTSFDSADEAVVTVYGTGLVAAIGPGETTVSASHGSLSAAATVRVGSGPTLTSIEINPASLKLEIGSQVQLQVSAFYSDGTSADVTATSTFESGDPALASVSAAGRVTAQTAGSTTIRASYRSKTAVCEVEVAPPGLTDVSVEPSALQLEVGRTAQLSVIAGYSDGRQEDVSGLAVYESIDPSVATVDGGGLVLALAGGATSVRASFGGLFDSCSVAVGSVDLLSIEIMPDTLELDIGQSAALSVRAHYSDGHIENVTAQSVFASNAPSVASVQLNGMVTGQAPGTATVSAGFASLEATCSVRVRAPLLDHIEITPSSAVLEIGDSLQLTVRAYYSDGSQADVTQEAVYDSSEPMVASVQGGGMLTAVGPGSAEIFATFMGVGDSCAVQVNAPVLVSIEISPHSANLMVGEILQFTVTGFYSDGSSMDMTAPETGTTYESSDASVLRVFYWGEVLAVSVGGPVTVTARLSGFSDTATLMVGTVEPPSISTLSPNSGLQGTSLRVVFYGSGLLGCDVSCENPGIAVSALSYSPDGNQLGATFDIAAGASPGVGQVVLENMAGSASTSFEVIENKPLEDLVINGPGVVYLEGVQAYHNIIIGTGATVYGTGNVPLQLLATGDVTVNGEIIVSGQDGVNGYYDPADGGRAGPGGGGGGGGGDGDSAAPSSGGMGAPAGTAGGQAAGAGTPSGSGGGVGAGAGISGGCGQAGGGGAFGGDGGNGGGDSGPGSGGQGGTANATGSDFNGGSGGGGGSTCGPNCGGGGGGGGGVLVISALSGGMVAIRGALFADGGSGGAGHVGTGAGGGGSGGRIVITTTGGSLVIEDTISTRGGDGGPAYRSDGGGGGGGGRIIIDAGEGTVDDSQGYYDVFGGAGGVSLDPQPQQPGYDGLPGDPGVVDVRP